MTSEIEVGASDVLGDLRYWRAKEAMRQGEARLDAQAAIRTAMEARATAITGWAATSLIVAAGAGFATTGWPARAGAASTALLLLGSAITCIHAARPREWSIKGYNPDIITADLLPTELEVLESLAAGIAPGIQSNNDRLEGMGRSLRGAGWMLITAPILGAMIYVLINILKS